MLSQVELIPVTREDVARVDEWISIPDVSEAWFGRYTYGDPTHLGYDPRKMINATEEEWHAVFDDPHSNPNREIFSVYTISKEHIGEAQVSIESGIGDGQVSVLIGRKDLWHHGYGTAATLALLEHCFDHLNLYRVWADVPEYNLPAVSMFKHIGFQHEGTLRKSRPHEGARANSVIMGILLEEYRERYAEGVQSHVAIRGTSNI